MVTMETFRLRQRKGSCKDQIFDVQSKVSTILKTVDVIETQSVIFMVEFLIVDGSTKVIGSKTPSTNEEQNRRDSRRYLI